VRHHSLALIFFPREPSRKGRLRRNYSIHPGGYWQTRFSILFRWVFEGERDSGPVCPYASDGRTGAAAHAVTMQIFGPFFNQSCAIFSERVSLATLLVQASSLASGKVGRKEGWKQHHKLKRRTCE